MGWELGVKDRIPATLATPSARPTEEYVADMMAATMESHHTWSKSGI